MNKQTPATLTLLFLILSGCAQKWTKLNAVPGEFEAMKAACASRSAMRYPPMLQPVTSTSCGVKSCFTLTVNVDTNLAARNQDTHACFAENGWTPANQSSASAQQPQTTADQDSDAEEDAEAEKIRKIHRQWFHECWIGQPENDEVNNYCLSHDFYPSQPK